MEDKVQELLFELEKVMNARFDSIDCRLDSMSNRFDSMINRFDSIINRFDSLDDNFDSIDNRFDSIDLQLKERGSLLNKIDKNMNLLISKTHDVKKEIECLKD